MKYELKISNKVVATIECENDMSPSYALLLMAKAVIDKIDHAGDSDQPSETDGASP